MNWFHRLAEVPKLGFKGSPGVDRTQLPGIKSKPKVEVYRWEGVRHKSMFWTTSKGVTSASPAASWITQPRKGESSAQTTLRQLYEVLELPGTLVDYHFAIQACCTKLWDWKTRRREPWVLLNLEKLCLLSIRLVNTFPDVITSDSDQKDVPQYYGVTAFWILIQLYKQEGYLHEAVEIARQAVNFDQQHEALNELLKRISQLEVEVEHS